MTLRRRFENAAKTLLLAVGLLGLFSYLALRVFTRSHGILVTAGVSRSTAWLLEASSFFALWPLLLFGFWAARQRVVTTRSQGGAPTLPRRGISGRYVMFLVLLGPLVGALKATVGRSSVLILLPLSGLLEAVGAALVACGAWLLLDAIRHAREGEASRAT